MMVLCHCVHRASAYYATASTDEVAYVCDLFAEVRPVIPEQRVCAPAGATVSGYQQRLHRGHTIASTA
jgi:hypothetical protein